MLQSRPMLQHRFSFPFATQDLATSRRMSEGELKRLLVRWSSVKGSAHIPCLEMDVIDIANEARHVRRAMLLFDALLVSREQMFLDSIDELNNMADKLGGGQKKMKAAGIAGGTVGGVGVAATVAGVALAPCTMGVSLVLAAAGVGMAAAGGAGGALALKKKTANTRRRKKVEEIVQDYKSNMADVEDCLGFIALGMERLRQIHPNVIQQLDVETYTMHRLAVELRDQKANLRLSRRSSSLSATGMDILVSKSDKNSEAARKIRQQVELMESGLGELIGIRDKINYVNTVHMLY
ncbi:apolipoprotein L4-like [Engraulis encrasicolus]|uniref:apolipoprotein L4-like n=1 Tax=Engraulis encrasicolus TaxID=184585 RepID=UPI002FD7469B